MKQVIIKIRDVDGKLRTLEYYYCYSEYERYAYIFVRDNLAPGYEVQVKVGNQYSAFKTYQEFFDDAIYNDVDIKKEIFDWLLSSDSPRKCLVKEYLPNFKIRRNKK